MGGCGAIRSEQHFFHHRDTEVQRKAENNSNRQDAKSAKKNCNRKDAKETRFKYEVLCGFSLRLRAFAVAVDF
jgi:hypothetical protein